jgi:NAD(P)H-hydrate epimerase
MDYPSTFFDKETALNLEFFKQMDCYAVENYKLTIELMMENAGLQLANFISRFADIDQKITIGIGK